MKYQSKIWTAEKQDFLEKNTHLNVQFLASKLDCSAGTIYQKTKAIKDANGGEPVFEYVRKKVQVVPKQPIIRPKAIYSNGITGSRLIANILNDNSSYIAENYTMKTNNVTIKNCY